MRVYKDAHIVLVSHEIVSFGNFRFFFSPHFVFVFFFNCTPTLIYTLVFCMLLQPVDFCPFSLCVACTYEDSSLKVQTRIFIFSNPPAHF